MPLFPAQASSALLIDDYLSYVDCGTPQALSFAGNVPYTISAWINYAAFTPQSSSYTVVSRYNYRGSSVDAYWEYQLIINADGTVSAWRNTGSMDYIVTSTKTIRPREWHHIAMSYDGQTLYLYIDGVLAASKLMLAPMRAALSANVVVGASIASGTSNAVYQGLIGYVRIWNVCLDVDKIVNSSVQIDVEDLSDPNQVAYFDFATIPGDDRSRTGTTLGFIGNASYSQDVPGVQLSTEGWANCGDNRILSSPATLPIR